MKKLWWIVFGLILAGALWLRLFSLTQSPPAPYWEEVALGYDAYSVLKTGRDHHGNPWPVVAFESFGDWKPSGYFYALLPFIKTFGLNIWAVRLPSVTAGVVIVVGLMVLTNQMLGKLIKGEDKNLVLGLSLLIATAAPWLVQFARGAWEANLATALILWGVICGLQAIVTTQTKRRRFLWLMLSASLLIGAMYTYHSARVLAPGLGLLLAWQFFQEDIRGRRKNIWLVGYLLPLLLTAVLLKPFLNALWTPALNQRVAETSLFSDTTIIETSNQLRDRHNYSPISRLMYHRFILFGGRVAEQFLSHFRLDFLFLSGDVNPRHSSQYFGLFYPFEAAFLLVGIWWALKYLPSEKQKLLWLWLGLGILPAAMTRVAPHALRILLTAPVWLFLITLGAWQTLKWCQVSFNQYLPKLKQLSGLWLAGLFGLYVISVAAFFRHLVYVYPQQFAGEWQYGYQQMVEAVEQRRVENLDFPIYISRAMGRPAMYYWFYTHTDPTLVQQADSQAKQDQGEFLEFNNLRFINNLSEIDARPAIVALTAKETEELNLTNSVDVYDPTNHLVWQIGVLMN